MVISMYVLDLLTQSIGKMNIYLNVVGLYPYVQRNCIPQFPVWNKNYFEQIFSNSPLPFDM